MPETLRTARIVWEDIPQHSDEVDIRQLAYQRYKADPGHFDTEPSKEELDTLVDIMERERQDIERLACIQSLARVRDEIADYERAQRLGEEV